MRLMMTNAVSHELTTNENEVLTMNIPTTRRAAIK